MTKQRPLRRATSALAVLAMLVVSFVVAAPVSAGTPATECADSCPMMAAVAAEGPGMEGMRCHRPNGTEAGMSCCNGSAEHPAVPLDEAVPTSSPNLEAPAPSTTPLPVVPAPAVRSARTGPGGDAPLPAGPELYTLHEALLN